MWAKVLDNGAIPATIAIVNECVITVGLEKKRD